MTKKGYSRSKWLLPDFFREVSIGYHSENSWKENYFQSAHRGQEFVISPNDKINLWAVNLIEKKSYPRLQMLVIYCVITQITYYYL